MTDNNQKKQNTKSMSGILFRRTGRKLKADFLRYAALCFLIILGMYMVIRIVGTADTVINGVRRQERLRHVEDGCFTVSRPLSGEIQEILQAGGTCMEKKFYMDIASTGQQVLRLFQVRRQMNQIHLDCGKMPSGDEEAVLEKRFAEEHHYHPGDDLTIGDQNLRISGIGSVPDYDAPYRYRSDAAVDSKQFGLVFVTESQYERFRRQDIGLTTEIYEYAFFFPDREDHAQKCRKLKQKLKQLLADPDEGTVLTDFTEKENNIRISGSADDQQVKLRTGIVAGIAAMLLFSYVTCVFVIHEIEKEKKVIGTLYALGVREKELVTHYLVLPVIMTLTGGVIGTLLGFSFLGVGQQIKTCHAYFSFPEIKTRRAVWLMLYGIVMPPVTAFLVNFLLIRKKLRQPSLSLLRGEEKTGKVVRAELKRFRYPNRFRIRQMIREARVAWIIFLGMFLSLIILMIGLDTYALCDHVSKDYRRDPKFSYMYIYQNPEKESREDAVLAYLKNYKKEMLGYEFDVRMLGIVEDQPYFDLAFEEDSVRHVIISSAMAQKFGLKQGQKFSLKDGETEKTEFFTVAKIIPYAVGFYLFVQIDDMRTGYQLPADSYNTLFSDQPLELEQNRLLCTTTREEIERSADVMINLMQPLILLVTAVSGVVFALVLYLMLKVVIERSAENIAFMQLLGYRMGELKKLYLNGHFYLVFFSSLITVPLSKKVMDLIFPYMIANLGSSMNLDFDIRLTLGLYGMILLIYWIISRFLTVKIKAIKPDRILSSRE